jgi:hypothetical protein
MIGVSIFQHLLHKANGFLLFHSGYGRDELCFHIFLSLRSFCTVVKRATLLKIESLMPVISDGPAEDFCVRQKTRPH